jgi:hypothetical protein
MKQREPHTFCKDCNRVIGESLVDSKGMCPDCCTGLAPVDMASPGTSEELPKRKWRSRDRDE